MFDSLKKSLGLSKSKQESKGYRLGGRVDPTAPESNETSYEMFERHFNAEKLGMSICESNDPLIIDMDDSGNPRTVSRVIVTDVVANSEGARLGVQPGDVIFSLNGFELQQFEDFHNIIGALERPILMKFFRYKYSSTSPKAAQSTTTTTTAKPGAASSSSGTTKPSSSASSTVASIFKMGGKQGSQEQLSDAELAERRAMRAKAVADRSSTIWDKAKNGKGGSINRSSSGTTGGSPRGESSSGGGYNPGPIVVEEIASTTNPETLRVIQKTKELEQNVEKSLGYSPFKPYMSFVGGSTSTQPIGDSAVAGAPPSLQQQNQEQVEEDEFLVAEVDDAFAMLLSLNDTEQEKAKVTVQTVQKMLQNLHASQDDPKFRSIRISNKAFQAKVAAIPGGVELLIAAGYRLELARSHSSSDLLSSQSDSGRWQGEGSNGGGLAEGKDGYLLHDMTPATTVKLAYTISRIEELMEMQGSR